MKLNKKSVVIAVVAIVKSSSVICTKYKCNEVVK